MPKDGSRRNLRRPTIGVFDSGVGGLTVLRALLDRIPNADYLYFGDTARLPYGSKSAATVAHYATGASRFLQEHGAELLIIACNTATALALDLIEAQSDVDVIGVVEPGAEAAAKASVNRQVVVLGTEATIASHAYRHALEAKNVTAREKACPLFVPLVEEGWIDHPVTEQVAKIYLAEAFTGDPGAKPRKKGSHDDRSTGRSTERSTDHSTNADVLLLGCTHYPLIKPVLRRLAPAHIAIVDSAESTADQVARQLQLDRETLPGKSNRRVEPHLKFFATDSAEKFKKMGTRFLGLPVEDVKHVDLKE